MVPQVAKTEIALGRAQAGRECLERAFSSENWQTCQFQELQAPSQDGLFARVQNDALDIRNQVLGSHERSPTPGSAAASSSRQGRQVEEESSRHECYQVIPDDPPPATSWRGPSQRLGRRRSYCRGHSCCFGWGNDFPISQIKKNLHKILSDIIRQRFDK